MSRTITATEKIDTNFGSFFIHIEYYLNIGGGFPIVDIHGVWVSMPQKHEDTDMQIVVESVVSTVHDMIQDINNPPGSEHMLRAEDMLPVLPDED